MNRNYRRQWKRQPRWRGGGNVSKVVEVYFGGDSVVLGKVGQGEAVEWAACRV